MQPFSTSNLNSTGIMENDPIRALIIKIDQKVPEVKYRSISSLHSKITAKLISYDELCENYKELPGVLMNFINDYQTETSHELMLKVINIMQIYSNTATGNKVLNEYEAIEFFCNYKNNVRSNPRLEDAISLLLQNMAQYKTMTNDPLRTLYGTTNGNVLRDQKENILNITANPNACATGAMMMMIGNETQVKKVDDMERTRKTSSEKIVGNKGLVQIKPDNFPTSNFPTGTLTQTQFQGLTKLSKTTYHLESDELVKLKQANIDFFGVNIPELSEADEKFLFDITVQLKYGDLKNIKTLLNEAIHEILMDFPLEALISQGELLSELMIIHRKLDEDTLSILHTHYKKLLLKIMKTYELYEDQGLKNYNQAVTSMSFMITDDKQYIKQSYPSLSKYTQFVGGSSSYQGTIKPNSTKTIPKSAIILPNTTTTTSNSLNMFHYFNTILRNTLDYLTISTLNDEIYSIWKIGIDILIKFKYKAHELVMEETKDLLRLFMKYIEDTAFLNACYNDMEFAYVYHIVYDLFKVITPKEYVEMMEKASSSATTTAGISITGSSPSLSLLIKNVLNNLIIGGVYNLILNDYEIDILMTSYVKVLDNELYEKYQKTYTFLKGIKLIKQKEDDLPNMKMDIISSLINNMNDHEKYIEFLEEILPSVEYCKYPYIIDIYIDIMLIIQNLEHKHSKVIYNTMKNMILNMINHPLINIKVLVLENMLNNLLKNEPIIKNHSARQNLIFQAFLDPAFFFEVVWTCLNSSDELVLNSLAKILINLITLCGNLTMQTASKYHHITDIIPLLHSTITLDDKKHESLLIAEKLLLKQGLPYLLHVLIMDLFSKDPKDRINALRFLNRPLLLQDLITGVNQNNNWANQYQENKLMYKKEQEQQSKPNNSVNSDAEDPLKGLIDKEGKFITYKEELMLNIKDLNIDKDDLENLLYVANDENIELSLRISSLEQLNEFLVVLLKSSQSYDNVIKELLLFTLDKLTQISINQPKNIPIDNNILYLIKLLAILNTIIESDNLSIDIQESLKQFLKIDRLGSLIKVLIQVISLKSSITIQGKYQVMRFLNYIGLKFNTKKVSKDEPSMGVISQGKGDFKPKFLQIASFMRNRYFLLGNYGIYEHRSGYEAMWSLYPMEGQLKRYIEMNVEQINSVDKKNRKTPQDIHFEGKLVQVMQSIRNEQDPRRAAIRWIRMILTFNEAYIPKACFENFDVWSVIVKIISGNLRGNMNYCANIIKKFTKSTAFQKEISVNVELVANISSFLEFLAQSVIPIFIEVPLDNTREKLGLIEDILEIIWCFLDVCSKVKNVMKIKQVLVKKIIKQSFIGYLNNLVNYYSNRESLFKLTVKLCHVILKYPEIYLVLDMASLFNLILNISFQIPIDDKFYNKHILRSILNFLQHYAEIDEDFFQENLQRFNQNVQNMSNLSTNTKKTIIKTSSLSWFMRLSENREIQFRIKTWKLMTTLLNKDILQDYPSIIDTALSVLYSPNEAYGVIMSIEEFLSKVLEIYSEITDIMDRDNYEKGGSNQKVGNEGVGEEGKNSAAGSGGNGGEVGGKNGEEGGKKSCGLFSINDLMTRFYRRNIISHLKNFLLIKCCPSLFKGNAIVLLKSICMINPAKTLPIISQLEIWDLIIEIFSFEISKYAVSEQCSVIGGGGLSVAGVRYDDCGDSSGVNKDKDTTTKTNSIKKSIYWDILIQNNNILQFMLYSISYDKQICDYLINCTSIIKAIIDWLYYIQNLYKEVEQDNAKIIIIDNYNTSLIQLINNMLLLNEQKVIFMINKIYEDNITNTNKTITQPPITSSSLIDSRPHEQNEENIDLKAKEYNIYYIISKIFYHTKTDHLLLSIYKLLSNLLPKWNKGYNLIENHDQNEEILSDTLVLSIYSQYKLNDLVWSDKKIAGDVYWENKCIMISCVCALMYVSNKAKVSLICSGFFAYILTKFNNANDKCILDENKTMANAPIVNSNGGNASTSPLLKKNKSMMATNSILNPNDMDISLNGISSLIAFKSKDQFSSKHFNPYDEVLCYIRIFKYLFIQAAYIPQAQSVSKTINNSGEDNVDEICEELKAKLDDHIQKIFDCYTAIWRTCLKKEELYEEFLKSLTNFITNSSINTLCFGRLIDHKVTIFNDILALVLKFDIINKNIFKLSANFLVNIAHSKELRNQLYKQKFLENTFIYLNKVWNLKKDFNSSNIYIISLIDIYLSLSFYKDAQIRILIEPLFLEMLLYILDQVNILRGGILAEKILILLVNLAYNKSLKHFYIKNDKIFAIYLAILSTDDQTLRFKQIASQLFVNILPKCTQAVALLKKEHIVDQFFYLKKEMERMIDKMTFGMTKDEDIDQEKLAIAKGLLENLNKINLMLT